MLARGWVQQASSGGRAAGGAAAHVFAQLAGQRWCGEEAKLGPRDGDVPGGAHREVKMSEPGGVPGEFVKALLPMLAARVTAFAANAGKAQMVF